LQSYFNIDNRAEGPSDSGGIWGILSPHFGLHSHKHNKQKHYIY